MDGTTFQSKPIDLTAMFNFGVASVLPDITYTFTNFFHPYTDKIVSTLSSSSLDSVMNGKWQESQRQDFFVATYGNPGFGSTITSYPQSLEVESFESYADYNWEFFFHAPLAVAVHLSKTRRFAEAQRWFHFVFNPLSTTSEEPPKRFWNFLAFRKDNGPTRIEDLLLLLDTDPVKATSVLNGYLASLAHPFKPHVVARSRPTAYQYGVVMKYLDNLLAWGDDLFRQDTIETINEATQIYILAANILGPRPQRTPRIGSSKAKCYDDLQNARPGLDAMGNALVELENAFPFNQLNLNSPPPAPDAGPLFGIGRTLYFCVPRNEKLLGYWDQVADRLFKIRHCMNIEGLVRSLALFEPPIDPSVLVAAIGAGFDVASIVSGLNQPIGPLRSLPLIQKAIELCNEVRSLGGALLTSIEKGDSERLAIVRQGHEIKVQGISREVRFLQWKSSEESTTSLLTIRATALQRLRYYQRLLGLAVDPNAPEAIELQRPDKLTQENFADVLAKLVGQYDKTLNIQDLPPLRLVQDNTPSKESGVTSPGRIYLNTNENADLNVLSPDAHQLRTDANVNDILSKPLPLIPDIGIKLHWWGLGGDTRVFGGAMLSAVSQMLTSALHAQASAQEGRAASASKTASLERRADDWILQYNLAACELMQNGRQIISSLLSEQIARHEYEMADQQWQNAGEINEILANKFSNEDLYLWMQGETSRLYYDHYRFAFEVAQRAERALKQELMRPELDNRNFVKFNYWDTGRKGLLAGEALLFDLKRMEMAYHDNNKRELEITKHVSLRKLDAIQLMLLRQTGTCDIHIPEELFALDFPRHYFRRIKSVAVSLPSVVGPYSSVSGTLKLTASSICVDAKKEPRAIGHIAVQTIATSNGVNDSGLFELNLREERYLPFEGAGAASNWTFGLPQEYQAFDYSTIADLILHLRYTAREGDETVSASATAKVKDWLKDVKGSQYLLLSVRQDFPTIWASHKHDTGPSSLSLELNDQLFPYIAQGTKSFSSSSNYKAFDHAGNPVTVTFGSAVDPITKVLELSAEISALSDLHLIVPYSIGQ